MSSERAEPCQATGRRRGGSRPSGQAEQRTEAAEGERERGFGWEPKSATVRGMIVNSVLASFTDCSILPSSVV
eukprot:2512717-Prymnesium_polylepis.1